MPRAQGAEESAADAAGRSCRDTWADVASLAGPTWATARTELEEGVKRFVDWYLMPGDRYRLTRREDRSNQIVPNAEFRSSRVARRRGACTGHRRQRICAISTPPIRSAGRIFTSSTTAGCSISRASASPAETLDAAVRARARGRAAGAHRGHVSRRSDQQHRAARGAAHRAALGFRRLGRRSKPKSRTRAKSSSSFAERGAPRRHARADRQEIQARGQRRHRRLGSRPVARVPSAQGRMERRSSRRISCRTWIARSSRI